MAPPPLALAELLRAAETAQAHVDQRLAAVNLSLPKLAALHQLVEAGDTLALGQLAERLSCVKSNVTQLVDRLEADGLVSREADPTDRRSRLAVITAAGRASYERGMRIREEAERELFGSLAADEVARVADVCRKIARR